MPDPYTFIENFGIKKGNYFGYFLRNINVSHKAIIPYKEYSYHVVLEYIIIDPTKSIIEFYNMHRFEPRVINSSYGNPYDCTLNKSNYTVNDRIFTIVLEGKSYRKY